MPPWLRIWPPRWQRTSPRRSSLGAFLAGEPQTALTTHLAAVEKAAAANLDATLASLQTTIDSRLETTADQARAASNSARVDLLWSIAIGLASRSP